jgi:DNA-binding transcriptional MerR regulator
VPTVRTNDEHAAKTPHYFGVTEVANMFGVSADTIRHYEIRGIYSATRITNRRVLTEDNVAAIEQHRKRLERKRTSVKRARLGRV